MPRGTFRISLRIESTDEREIDVEQLSEAIKRYPCIWQVGSKSYEDDRACLRAN